MTWSRHHRRMNRCCNGHQQSCRERVRKKRATLLEVALGRVVIFYSTGARQSHIFSNALQPSRQLEPILLRIKEECLYCCVAPIVRRPDKDKARNIPQEDGLY